jgi:hypothetical protein
MAVSLISSQDIDINQSGNTIDLRLTSTAGRIGTQKQAFGDIFTSDGRYTAYLYSNLVATYIGNKTWKIDFSGKIENNTGVSGYYNYGISISKISTLLDLDLECVVSSGMDYISNWIYYGTDGKIDEALFGYGTIYEYKSNINALLFTRIYTTSGSVGGWALNHFVNDSLLTGTIYLKEV